MKLRTPLTLGGLLLCMLAGTAWAEGPAAQSAQSASSTSNIEGWHDEEEDALDSNWTWFGMGYESRVSGNSNAGASRSGPGAGAGTAAAVMNQRGPGNRR